MNLTFSHGISVQYPDVLVEWYNFGPPRKPNMKQGRVYYASTMMTGSPEAVGFEDLVWAVLLNGRPSGVGARNLLQAGPVSLRDVPSDPLHALDDDAVDAVVRALVALCVPGLGCADASKMMHPKRRKTVPVLDTRAIFGSFANTEWAAHLPKWAKPIYATNTVRTAKPIRNALQQIRGVLADPRNQAAWESLEKNWHPLTRVELFDQCWWTMTSRKGGQALRTEAGVTP